MSSPDQAPVPHLGAAGQHQLEPGVIETVEVQLLVRVLRIRIAAGVIIPAE